MTPPLARLRRILLRLAAQAARERWDRARLDREVMRAFRESGVFTGDSPAPAADLSAEVSERYVRLTTRTSSPQAQLDAGRVLQTAGRDVTRIRGKLRDALLDDMTRVLRTNGLVSEVEDVVRRRTRQAEHAVRTVAQTAAGGFDRAQTLAQAAGVDNVTFRYAGPPADRTFCQTRLTEAANGVTYTEAQIRSLDNGQGLDVALYCGGYNCRHRWIAVVPRTAPAPPVPPAPDPAAPPAYTDAEWLADLGTLDTLAIRTSRDKGEYAQAVAGKTVRPPKRTKDAGLTPDEAFPVYLYTREGFQPHHYRNVNRRLYEAHRDGTVPGDTPPLPDGWTQAYERATNAAIRRLPTHQGTVWRKVDRGALSAADGALFDAAHVPGAIVEYGAFTSTSATRSTAEGFRGDTLLRITSKSGRDVSKVSSLKGEREILFPTRSRFRVVDVDSTPAPDGTPRRTIILEEE